MGKQTNVFKRSPVLIALVCFIFAGGEPAKAHLLQFDAWNNNSALESSDDSLVKWDGMAEAYAQPLAMSGVAKVQAQPLPKVEPVEPVRKDEQDSMQVFRTRSQWIELAKIVPFLHKEQLTDLPHAEVTATGYYAGKESTGKDPGHPEYGYTFSGVKVRRDVFSTVAADPKVFPIGTVLYIFGYGYGVVADTGSAIKGKKLDLYYESKDMVYSEWGKKKTDVIIIKKGSGKLTEEDLDRLNAMTADVKLNTF